MHVICVLFFSAFYLFLRLCIETELIYYYFEMCRKASFFRTGWPFLRDCLVFPGGPTQYTAAFFTQLCCLPWIGPLAITLLAWGIYRCTVSLTAVAADSPWRVICYLPVILILMICGRYENPLSMSVAVLVVAFFSVLYQKISPHLGRGAAILFLIFSGLLYYVAGSTALVFVVLAALCEFFDRRKPFLSAFCLFLGPAVCWLLGAYLFKLDDSDSYLFSLPFVPIKQILEKEKLSRIFGWALFVVIPMSTLFINVYRVLLKERITFHLPVTSRDSGTVPQWVLQTVLLVLIAVPSVLFSFDWKAKRTLQVCFFARQRNWPEALAVAQKGSLRKYFPFCSNAVNRALYYTGKLGDEMFAYPQNTSDSDLVFCKIQRGNVIFMERAEVCLDLGMVNVAQEVATEFMAGTDGNPYILKQLALINIVKGQVETARVYLRALSQNLVYRAEAMDLLRRLETDPLLERDERIQYLRSVSMNRDIGYIVYDEGAWLEELLGKNKHNKMAFEYLMAHCLLNKNLDKFIENLPRLDDFGYKEIPRHYQEAILLYIGITQKDVDIGSRGINAEVKEQYDKINELGQSMNNNVKLLQKVLAEKFGKTYFFYFTFGFSESKQ
ncbi:MAG: hypothetical protein JW749_05215 [Sedimentisphaerales bacterium]|nr:hypothetical protein [Sedimentisphaerales bacterium]